MSQYPVVVFPDAVEVMIALLNNFPDDPGPTVTTYSQVPATRPDAFAVVSRVGGPRHSRFRDQPQIVIDSWGTSGGNEPIDVAQRCRAILHAAVGQSWGGSVIGKVTELGGPGWLPDPESNQPRYSQQFTVTLRPLPDD